MDYDEWEEETSYLTFDLGKNVTSEYIETVSRTEEGCTVIGLEEGEPYLQLGELIFEGQIDETIGTHLFFEIKERKAETAGLLPLLSSIRADGEDGPKPQRYAIDYKFSTETIVTLEPVTFQRKDDDKKEPIAGVSTKVGDDSDEDEPMIL